jgi:myxalamid-type nonribosomal peptide synthetase MxaA
VLLPCFPLTVNGKLDRRALPAPGRQAHANRQYQPPRGEVEEILANIWQALLGVERVGRDDNFFELGGHSLLALALIVRTDQLLGQLLSVSDVYRCSTLAALASRTSEGVAKDEWVDLSQNAALDPQIVAKAGVRRAAAQVVLLTGCTGFVGRFLLAQLLADTDATICCLVRAESPQQAMQRLEAMLMEWDLWRGDVLHRVRAVPADLSRPRLGLRDDAYEVLAATVDSIYHCAASMNHLETYEMARPANVDATRSLLEFAVHGRPKLVNYISTLGVFGDHGAGGCRVVTEDTPIDRERHLASAGYSASKWVSEKLLMIASERGVACNIMRLGLVWADSRHGRYDPLQREYRLFKSCLLSGLAIQNYEYDAAPLPVDHVARAIVCLGSRHANGGGIFHLASPAEPVGHVFEHCNAQANTSLELLTHHEWICAMRDRHWAGWSLPIVPLIEFAFSMTGAEFWQEQRRAKAARLRADCTKTRIELESAGVLVPCWDEALLERCITDMCSRDKELRLWANARRCTAPRRKHG